MSFDKLKQRNKQAIKYLKEKGIVSHYCEYRNSVIVNLRGVV